MKWEDFKESVKESPTFFYKDRFKKTNIDCPKCGSPIYRDCSIVLSSIPAQYQYICKNCDWEGTAYG